MSALHDLLTRVELATGPDRALEADIYLALFPDMEGISDGFQGVTLADAAERHRLSDPNYWPIVTLTYDLDPVSESIDAALALVDRLLPDWQCWFAARQQDPSGEYSFDLRRGQGTGVVIASAPTLQLAILAALLKALIAQEATRKETA